MINNFSSSIQDYIALEPRVNHMLTFLGHEADVAGPQTHYFQKGKLIKIFNNDLKFLDIYTQKQPQYAVLNFT